MKYASFLFASLALALCAATASAAERSVTVPGPNGTTETFVVPTAGPGERVEWLEEKYKDYEPREEVTGYEMHTAMVKRQHDVVHKKIVAQTMLAKVRPVNAQNLRLARGRTLVEKEYTRKETIATPEEHPHPVKETVYYEVEKTRKIPVLTAAECE